MAEGGADGACGLLFGWIGAIGAFLAVALTASDSSQIGGTFAALEAIGRFVLVPLSLTTLLTGIVQALGTVWGLVRHYWVLAKLAITLLAATVLRMYMPTLSELRRLAKSPAAPNVSAASPILHASAALTALLVALGLSIFKPKGPTGLGAKRS